MLALAVSLLALPAFVAAPKHRAAVEAFASRLTGRAVNISGRVSLSYWPQPEIRASGITITGPNKEVITARALALDLALPPLLHGQFVVRTLDLDTPTIFFPWPLPGGIRAVAPPPWLAALHAHIDNGLIRFGAVDFTKVNADLFTGSGGSVSVSGSGQLDHHPASLSVAIGKMANNSLAQISAQGAAWGAKATLSGTLNSYSELNATLALQLPGNMAGNAQIQADAVSISASKIFLNSGHMELAGNAKLGFKPLALEADITGNNVDLSKLLYFQRAWPPALPAQVDFAATHILLLNKAFPALRETIQTGPRGILVKNLSLDLPHGGNLSGNLTLAPDSSLSGHANFSSPDLAALASDLGIPAETAWTTAHLQADIGGNRSSPVLKSLSGTLGKDHVNGQINLTPGHAAFRLAFDNLSLLPLATWLGQQPLSHNFTVEGELTAAQATAGPVKLFNLFVDASLDGFLNIRRASAGLSGGIVSGGATLGNNFKIASAHAFLNLPSAAPLAALLPIGLKLPPDLLRPHLSLLVAAAGPPNALATSAVAKLGDFTLTASPVIDLSKPSLSGPVSLRHPNAILAMKLLGFNAGCASMAPLPGYPFQGASQACDANSNDPSLAFPGPGSLSLRARAIAAPNNYGLSDFVLSAGMLNASGQLLESQGRIMGQINAGTLALPRIPASLQMPSSLPFSGTITWQIERLLYAGTRIFGPSAATLTLTPNNASLTLKHASLGNGNASGSASLHLASSTPPTLNVKISAQHVNANALNINQEFPLTLSRGQITVSTNLTAHGYTAKALAATLGGNATATVSNGTLIGLSLPELTVALKKANRPPLSKALTSGSTPFSSMAITAAISQGNCSLTEARLKSPSGDISATGDIDLFDSTLALRLTTSPAVTPPVSLGVRLIGAWSRPIHYYDLLAAEHWHPAHQ